MQIIAKQEKMFDKDGVGFYNKEDLDRFVTNMDALFVRLYELQEMGFKVRLVRDGEERLTFVRVVHDSSEKTDFSVAPYWLQFGTDKPIPIYEAQDFHDFLGGDA